MMPERKTGIPDVVKVNSFREIVENFTDPREVLREAISNALDWGASSIKITIYEDVTRPDRELVMKIRDNGVGLTKKRFTAFWNLADPTGLEKNDFSKKLLGRVGEKGHGTKTYWKCRLIEVESMSAEEDGTTWHVIAEMKEPINTLMQGKLPMYEYSEQIVVSGQSFTQITIKGYYVDSKEDFRHDTVKDYIQWFTKFGSIEIELENTTHKDKILDLQGLGRNKPERIVFGHPFPPESNNIKLLRTQWQDSWPNYYVNRWVFSDETVEGYPSHTIDVVFYLEGDSVKRQYNNLLTRPGRTRENWHYTVSDRYGIYVCKDHIPLPATQRVNDWVAEKSEWTLYHAFVNCQDFALTANRGSIGNTDRAFLLKVKETVDKIFKTRIKSSKEYQIYRDEIESTKERSALERTEEQEKSDFQLRYDHVKGKRIAQYQPKECPSMSLIEPRQEAEVLTLFSILSATEPKLFPFNIVDYSTSRGIDALCLLEPAEGGLQKGNLRYVEFKKALTHDFKDHTFARLAAIVCWECNLKHGAKVHDLAGKERTLNISKDLEGHTVHTLLAPPELPTNNIMVYVLKEYLADKLGVTFKPVV